jgi:xylulokinase
LKKLLLGIDIGTTGTKAALFNRGGELLGQGFEPSRLIQIRPGVVEQDLGEIYEETAQAVRRCLSTTSEDPKDVAAISIDGQMAGICGIDEDWNPVTPYDSWLDTQSEPFVRRMMNLAGDRIIQLSGGPASFNHGPKILWWKNERPERYQRISKFVMPSVYVAGKMAGLKSEEAWIDYTYLHFSCLSDLMEKQWSKELCTLFDIDLRKLPRILSPWDRVGDLSEKEAKEFGLVPGIPIAAGCGDTAATVLGGGVVRPGMAIDVAGTASCLITCTDRFTPDVKHRTVMWPRGVIPGLFTPIAYINGGGLNLEWFKDQFGQTSFEELDRLAEALEPGANRLLSIPHFGGRVCPNDPHVRGLWMGFSWNHRKEHFYRSLLESIAFEYGFYLKIQRDLQPEQQFEEVRVIGGGAKSRVWNQIKADVLQIPYARLNQEEFATLGGAIIGGRMAGFWDDPAEVATRFAKPGDRIDPIRENSIHYQKLSDLYEELLSGMKELFEKVSQG